jgi:3-oxoacyl-(acyl-carrier-protein) synthase
MLLMQNNEAKTVMVGGVDEITSYYVEAMKIAGNLKEDVEAVENAQSKGVILGEGATFVLASADSSEKNKATIKEVKTFFRPKNATFLEAQIQEILQRNDLSIQEIDYVLLGNSGDVEKDTKLRELKDSIFSETEKVYFKNVCGEYHTATGFALQQAVDIISSCQEKKCNVLIINHYQDTNYSILLISK